MPRTAAQEEFARIVAPTPRSQPGIYMGRRSADSSPPGSASSRSSSPASPAISPAMPSTNVYQIPNTAFDANTGPKGVIADAQSYERARKRTFRQTIYGMTTALSNNVIGATEKFSASVRSGSRRSSEGTSDSDEDEFMRDWREKRMAELKKGEQVRTRRQSPSKRRWGKLVAVDPIGYLDAVEKVTADTLVVVLIANDESSVSQAVENGISNLARKYDLTRFVKLNYIDAEMDAAAAPGVLAYRNGELIANLVSIADEIPSHRGLSSAALEDVMKEHMPLM